MKQVEEIQRPLFLGMTRPPMVAGVTFSFFVINGLTGIIAFLGTNELPMLLISLPIHFVGWIICLRDPNIFEVWRVKCLKCMQCLNKRFWGGINSYEPW